MKTSRLHICWKILFPTCRNSCVTTTGRVFLCGVLFSGPWMWATCYAKRICRNSFTGRELLSRLTLCQWYLKHRESALRTAGFFYWLPRWSDKQYKIRLTRISTWMEWTSIIYVPLLSLAAIVDGNEWCFRTSFIFLWGIGSDPFKSLHSLWERIIGSLQVTLVGMAREKEESATDVSFQLDDSTGQIEVKRWSLLFP